MGSLLNYWDTVLQAYTHMARVYKSSASLVNNRINLADFCLPWYNFCKNPGEQPSFTRSVTERCIPKCHHSRAEPINLSARIFRE